MKTIFISLFAVIFAANLFAADLTADFSAANKLYAEGKFVDAARAYQKILDTGEQSPALIFNFANAEFKSGRLGGAIANYRWAEQLAPHDSDIRANLAFVRGQVQGATAPEKTWRSWLGQFSVNEWTVLAALALWFTFLLLAAGQLKPAVAARLKSVTWTFAALTIFFGAIAGVQAADHFSPVAVVTMDGAVARSGPFDEAQSAFTLHDGAELPVLARHEDWVEVNVGNGKTGWLPLKQVAVLPGA